VSNAQIALVSSRLYDLYVMPGSSWYEQHENGLYTYHPEPATAELVVRHVAGDVTVGLPSSWNGTAKWMTANLNQRDQDVLKRAIDFFLDSGIRPLVSFSGDKGYHIDLFVEPSPTEEVVAVGRYLEASLRGAGVLLDGCYPLGNGGKSGGSGNIKLPCGIHRGTGDFCSIVDLEHFQPVSSPFQALKDVAPMPLGELKERLEATQAQEDTALPAASASLGQIHWRPCVKVLWKEGLQAPHTRHQATMVICRAVAEHSTASESEKIAALTAWAKRMYAEGRRRGFISPETTEEYALSEALRLYEQEAEALGFAVNCTNKLYRKAMKSACRDEVTCKMRLNRENINLSLLRSLGIFNPANARDPGVGRSSLTVYEACLDLHEHFGGRHLQYEDMPAFAAPVTSICDRGGGALRTIRDALKALCAIGLLVKVPREKTPSHLRAKQIGGTYQTLAPYYCIMPLTQEHIEKVVLPKARAYRKNGKK